MVGNWPVVAIDGLTTHFKPPCTPCCWHDLSDAKRQCNVAPAAFDFVQYLLRPKIFAGIRGLAAALLSAPEVVPAPLEPMLMLFGGGEIFVVGACWALATETPARSIAAVVNVRIFVIRWPSWVDPGAALMCRTGPPN